MSLGSRVVLHVDVDGFYCACEVRRNASLQGKPLAVTQFNSGGFVALSVEAARAGIRKGDGIGTQGHKNLPQFKNRPDALLESVMQKCPDLIIMPMDTTWYRQCSEDLLSLMQEFNKDFIVEKTSIDDFFVDVSKAVRDDPQITFEKGRMRTNKNNDAGEGLAETFQKDKRENQIITYWGLSDEALDIAEVAARAGPSTASACVLAADLRHYVKNNLGGMSISVGIGPNKLLARLVSKRKLSPNSQTIVLDEMAPNVAASTNLQAVPGLKGKLGNWLQEKYGLQKLSDLQSLSDSQLSSIAPGKVTWLQQLAKCQDDTRVLERGPPKSIMTERSFPPTSSSCESCQKIIFRLCKDLLERLCKERDSRSRTPSALSVQWRVGYDGQRMTSRRLSPFPCTLETSDDESNRLARLVTVVLPENTSSINRIALQASTFQTLQANNIVSMFSQQVKRERQKRDKDPSFKANSNGESLNGLSKKASSFPTHDTQPDVQSRDEEVISLTSSTGSDNDDEVLILDTRPSKRQATNSKSSKKTQQPSIKNFFRSSSKQGNLKT